MAKAKTRTKGTIGIIGLGIMGGAFARNLVKAGFRVVGTDLSAARQREAVRAGVEVVADAAAVAQAATTIITSLPKPEALTDVARAIAKAKLAPCVIVEASTFTIEDKQTAETRLRKAGHTLLDCPVSGTGAQAATGDIVVYASGDTAAIRKLKPVFAGFARAAHDVGAFGNGCRMKYVANLLVAIHNVATAEAMVLGMKAGLDPQLLFDMVRGGAGNSRVFELRAPMMVRDDYQPATMKCAIWQKDMHVIGAFAKKLKVPTPLFAATAPIYDAALRQGHGEDDTAAVCAVLEKKARLTRPRRRRTAR